MYLRLKKNKNYEKSIKQEAYTKNDIIGKPFNLSHLEDLLNFLNLCYGFEDSFKIILIDKFFTKNKHINSNDIRSSERQTSNSYIESIDTNSKNVKVKSSKNYVQKQSIQDFIEKYINIDELDSECYDKYYKKYSNNLLIEKQQNEQILKSFLNEIETRNNKLLEIEELNEEYLKTQSQEFKQFKYYAQEPNDVNEITETPRSKDKEPSLKYINNDEFNSYWAYRIKFLKTH